MYLIILQIRISGVAASCGAGFPIHQVKYSRTSFGRSLHWVITLLIGHFIRWSLHWVATPLYDQSIGWSLLWEVTPLGGPLLGGHLCFPVRCVMPH